jgi:hypothetical protein
MRTPPWKFTFKTNSYWLTKVCLLFTVLTQFGIEHFIPFLRIKHDFRKELNCLCSPFNHTHGDGVGLTTSNRAYSQAAPGQNLLCCPGRARLNWLPWFQKGRNQGLLRQDLDLIFLVNYVTKLTYFFLNKILLRQT